MTVSVLSSVHQSFEKCMNHAAVKKLFTRSRLEVVTLFDVLVTFTSIEARETKDRIIRLAMQHNSLLAPEVNLVIPFALSKTKKLS